ncbi:hypothetical protein SOVF_039740 [Spinacia oleracea]|nr:hypothetical protein SOVF_039740 [Spinacia oleracea]
MVSNAMAILRLETRRRRRGGGPYRSGEGRSGRIRVGDLIQN